MTSLLKGWLLVLSVLSMLVLLSHSKGLESKKMTKIYVQLTLIIT